MGSDDKGSTPRPAPKPNQTRHTICVYMHLYVLAIFTSLQIQYLLIALSSLATYSRLVLSSEIQVPSFSVKGSSRMEAKAGLECRSLSTGVIN